MPKARFIKKVAQVLPPKMFEVATSVYQFGRNAFLPTVNVPEGTLPEKNVKAYYKSRKFGPGKKVCYAPFNNMYFAIDGKVMACCYNRDVPLGFYPENSISQIWKGAKANELRERIDNFDLGGGCQLCKQQLVAGDYSSVMAAKYDYEAEDEPQYPTRFDFELSNTCNLECIMCSGEFSSSIRKNREHKAPIISPYGAEFLAQLDEYIPHLKVANFLGGEPFLIDSYYSIWEKIITLNPNCEIRLQTNATVMNAKVKNLLEKGNFHIGISIDSFNKKTYEAIRVNANYDRVIENIQFLAEYSRKKNTFLTLSFCPLRSNWNELPQVLEFANKIGALLNINTVMQPAVQSLWTLSHDKLKAIENVLTAYTPTQNNFFEKHNATVIAGFIKQVQSWATVAITRQQEIDRLDAVSDDILLQIFLAKIEEIFSYMHALNPDEFILSLNKFNNLIVNFLDAQTDKHKILVKLNALPFEWIKYDTEIFDNTKFIDKIEGYLLE